MVMTIQFFVGIHCMFMGEEFLMPCTKLAKITAFTLITPVGIRFIMNQHTRAVFREPFGCVFLTLPIPRDMPHHNPHRGS
jgi:hypothetical protein